jgi:hypothetical protein
MKHDRVELTPRTIVMALLYAAGKSFILYFSFASVALNLTEELPGHATLISWSALGLGAVAGVYWVLRPFYVLVVHRRDLG